MVKYYLLIAVFLFSAGLSATEEAVPGVPAVPVQEGYTFRDFYACTDKYSVPAFLGWCHYGDFYGPVHAGSIIKAETDNSFYGLVQVSILSYTYDRFWGLLQIGLIADAENMRGLLQVGLITGAERSFIGLGQVGVANLAGHSKRDPAGASFIGLFQIGLVNFTTDLEKSIAIQISAIFSASTTHYGLEIGPGNVCKKEMFGAQIGIYNRAVIMRGVQIGIYNQADELYGVQIGLINKAGNGMLPYFPVFNVGW